MTIGRRSTNQQGHELFGDSQGEVRSQTSRCDLSGRSRCVPAGSGHTDCAIRLNGPRRRVRKLNEEVGGSQTITCTRSYSRGRSSF